jgi:hypothetical protein
MQHMNHGSEFQALWDQLRKEVVALQARATTGMVRMKSLLPSKLNIYFPRDVVLWDETGGLHCDSWP